MDTNKNSYTLIYATIMVVVVALTLALVSGALKSKQEANIQLDKKKQILNSLSVDTNGKDIEKVYNQLIVKELIINTNGKTINEGKEVAFNIDFVKEMAKSENDRKLPVYIASVDGQNKYILSLHGSGLWGPIWGYVAFNEDKNTIFGSYFSHASETPGLGAEIAEKSFQTKFSGKKVLNSKNEFVSIAIVKPGQTTDEQDYVDGISGGTITSKGVESMLMNSLGQYKLFLENKNNPEATVK